MPAYLHKKKDLDPQTIQCMSIGYIDDVNEYKLLDVSTYKSFIEKSLWFDEIHLHAPHVKHAHPYALSLIEYLGYDTSYHCD